MANKSKCFSYLGICLDLSVYDIDEPNDFDSPLIRRCATALDLGADQGSILQLCSEAGQSPEHAFLTYQAATILSKSRVNT